MQNADVKGTGKYSSPDRECGQRQQLSSRTPVTTALGASFSCLDSEPVDLFASSVPQGDILSCLCAKLNISFLLGNLIFHRLCNNIFLRRLPAKHFPQEDAQNLSTSAICLADVSVLCVGFVLSN